MSEKVNGLDIQMNTISNYETRDQIKLDMLRRTDKLISRMILRVEKYHDPELAKATAKLIEAASKL